MKGALVLLILLSPLGKHLFAQEAKSPDLQYKTDVSFFKLPEGVYFGECVGVNLDSKGNIYVINRGVHPIMEFHPDGEFMRFIGEGLSILEPNADGNGAAHSVVLDKQDNIWYVDAGTNTITELNQQGRFMMILGKKPEPWTWLTHGATQMNPIKGPAYFNQPTGIAFAADGSIFITDGYGNSRVAKFKADGNFEREWGEKGKEIKQFSTPHGVVIDPQGNVYIADRGNKRIQIFDQEGNFLRAWDNVGAPWAMCLTPGPNPIMWTVDGQTGKFYKLNLNDEILGTFGRFGKAVGETEWTHGLACPSEDTLYAAEELNYRMDKITVQPVH
jgi:DNA-binding beta-propeller fold protein YncE